jgi:hypothetical protein
MKKTTSWKISFETLLQRSVMMVLMVGLAMGTKSTTRK